MVKDNEGHGFHNEENSFDFYDSMENFLIYKSSAGSGKTYTLVKQYLKLVLNNPGDFRHTLAITFTNKAADEMRQRVIERVIALSEDTDRTLKELLISEGVNGDIQE